MAERNQYVSRAGSDYPCVWTAISGVLWALSSGGGAIAGISRREWRRSRECSAVNSDNGIAGTHTRTTGGAAWLYIANSNSVGMGTVDVRVRLVEAEFHHGVHGADVVHPDNGVNSGECAEENRTDD